MDGKAESSRSAGRAGSASPQRSDPSMSPSRSPSDASMASSRSRSASPPRFRPPSPQRHPSGTPSDDSSRKNSTNKTALRITHLTSNVRESHLRHIFGWYGDVVRIHLTPSRRIGGEGRDAWAYILMGSLEHAAKAALYMSGGQIDGAIINIKTCEPPTDLPPEQPRQRDGKDKRWSGGRDGRDTRYDTEEMDDSRGERRPPPRREREWGGAGSSREGARGGLHPDRQRMISVGASRERLDGDQRGGRREDGGPSKMRRWGQRDQDATSSRRDSGSGRRERSRSRSMSPPQHGRRRSSATMRASPTY